MTTPTLVRFSTPELILEVNTMSVFRNQPFPFLYPAPLGFCWAQAAQSQHKLKTGLFSCILGQLVLKILYRPLFSSLKCPILDPYPGSQAKVFEVQGTTQKRTQMWDQSPHSLVDKAQAIQTLPVPELK